MGTYRAATPKTTQDRFKNQNLRTVWQKLKQAALNEVKKSDPDDAKALAAQFDKGLGPLLDDWDKETAKWPKYDVKKLGELGAKIATVMAAYNNAASGKGAKTSMIVSGTLSGIAAEMNRRLKWYRENLPQG